MNHFEGLEPNYEFYDVFKVVKPQTISIFDNIELYTENTEHDKILRNIEKLKEGIWYKVHSEAQKQAFKDLMNEGFLNDVVFNDEFTKVKRQDTEIVMNLILGNGIKKTERVIKGNRSKKAV